MAPFSSLGAYYPTTTHNPNIYQFHKNAHSVNVLLTVGYGDIENGATDSMTDVVNRWRMDYNHYRPHSSLRYMTPAEFAQLCHEAGCVRPKRLLYKNEEVRGNTLIKVGP